MACSRLQVLKFVGFFVGLAAKFVTGSIFVFNVYQDAIKVNFNYTQTEVELLSSLLNIGLGVGFVPGMLYDRFGPTITSGAGLIVSVPVYLLIWSTVKYRKFYSENVWLMAIYFVLAGFGSVFTYMVALNTNVINFSSKHTGKIVGFLNAFFAGSPSVFATVYYKMFADGDSTIVENQDFAGFMLFLAILYGIVNILCMVFLRIYKEPEHNKNDISITFYKDSAGVVFDEITIAANGNLETEDINTDIKEETVDDLNKKNSSSDSKEPMTLRESKEPMTLRETLCNIDYQLFAWMFAFASSAGLVYGNNITVTSKAMHLDNYNSSLVIIVPITNAIVSASIGILSDLLKEKIPRLALVVMACLSFAIAQALVLIFAQTYVSLIVATVFDGIGVGIIWSLCPTITKEMFSVEHLGRNWGIALLLAALLALASQELFGALYDAKIPEGEGNNCYGKSCIEGGYGVFLGVALVAFVLGIIILVRRRCCKKKSN